MIEFLMGTALGLIPVGLVLYNLKSSYTTITGSMLDKGSGLVLSHEPSVDPIDNLLKLVVENMAQYPERWSYHPDSLKTDKTNGTFSISSMSYSSFYGAVNKKDNIWFGRKLTTQDYFICGLKIEEKRLDGLMKFIVKHFEKATEIKQRKEIESISRRISKLNKPVPALGPNDVGFSKKEAKRSDTVDPFRKNIQRPYLYDRAITTLYGKPITTIDYDVEKNLYYFVDSEGRSLIQPADHMSYTELMLIGDLSNEEKI